MKKASNNNNSIKLTYNKESWTADARCPAVPPVLEKRGVTSDKWERIFDSFHFQLIPVVRESEKMETTFRKEMLEFTNKQMVKGSWGFGQESHHEKKVHLMVHQAGVLQNNATMVASNVLAQANAHLNPYGIMVQLVLKSYVLPKYSVKQAEPNQMMMPVGLEFITMG